MKKTLECVSLKTFELFFLNKLISSEKSFIYLFIYLFIYTINLLYIKVLKRSNEPTLFCGFHLVKSDFFEKYFFFGPYDFIDLFDLSYTSSTPFYALAIRMQVDSTKNYGVAPRY